MGVQVRKTWSNEELFEAVSKSKSIRGVARFLYLCHTSTTTLNILAKKIYELKIDISHFTKNNSHLSFNIRKNTPLSKILTENSTFSRCHLKERLYKENLKKPICELCGQGETWIGKRMSLILDHINGIRDDNRIENLRIVCPNCNATLETHCGRKNKSSCSVCGNLCKTGKKFCSKECHYRFKSDNYIPSLNRKVNRPTMAVLKKDIACMSMCAVGRKYGVSDNAIRKWIKWYEKANS
jgi:hypothetical protein